MRKNPRPWFAAISLTAALSPFTPAQNQPPKVVTGKVAFTKQVIDDRIVKTHAVAAADFNGDGLLDVVATDFIQDRVLWYENDGQGGFTRIFLDTNLEGAYPVTVGDLDLDGDPDVLAGGFVADLFTWYENDGQGVFTRHVIDTSDGPHSIIPGDLDEDGDNDLITTSQDGGLVAWYENDGQQNFTPHVIDAAALGAKSADFADFDGDGDLDVVAASASSAEITWYENDGQQGFTRHFIEGGLWNAYYVSPTDLDRDGDMDFLAAVQSSNEVSFYENDGTGSFTKRLVDDSAAGARSVIAADIDGDGFVDALAASVNDDTLAWHANLGCGEFTEHAIELGGGAVYGVHAVDMDHDGDLDVLAAYRDSWDVALHTQRKRHEVEVAFGGSTVIDASVLLAIDEDDAAAELIYTLTDGPDSGSLELGGIAIPVGGTFTQADVNSGSVRYVHGGSGVESDPLSFTLQDGGEDGVLPAEVDVVMVVPETGSLMVELPLDEGSGTAANDVSGNGNGGTLMGGPTFETNVTSCGTHAVRFDGVDDYIDLGALDPGGSALTLATWLNADSFPGVDQDTSLISKASGIDADDHIFLLGTIKDDEVVRLRGRVRIGGTATTLIASAGNLQTGVWHHAAMTYDGITLRLYLDGVQVGATPLAGNIDQDGTMSVAVGGQPQGAGDKYFDGLVDDVRIFERGLQASEVLALATGFEGFRTYGAGLAGSLGITPRLSGSGCLRLEKNMSIDVHRGLPGALGALGLGGAKSAQRIVGGWLLIDPVDVVPVVLTDSGDCPGSLSLPVTIPNMPSLVGATLYCQAVFLDPGAPEGISFTQGLEMVIRE